MTTPEPDPKLKRAKGNAPQRSALDIDRMSEVTEADIARARKVWTKLAPEMFKGLIDATPDPDDK